MDPRLTQLTSWLRGKLGRFEIAPASADASFRRYFRVRTDAGTWIAMDAPPEREDCGPFVHVAERFAETGLHVPDLLERDLDQGFLLLSDLGDLQYAAALTDETVDRLYADALDALLVLQSGERSQTEFPAYDEPLLSREMGLFGDWLLTRHLGLDLSDDDLQTLAQSRRDLCRAALDQPRVWVHRDYHSRNLMVVAGNGPGILDFQDAVVGPITYDLVSLLRDCYVRWPTERVYDWVEGHRIRLLARGVAEVGNAARFRRWFDLMGVQRHLKASGIFARLYHRDGKSAYLPDIPRTVGYIAEVAPGYPELDGLARLIESRVLPRLEDAVPCGR